MNTVYIATSIDGYIADRNNRIDWLEMIPNPENKDLGFGAFMNRIDAIVMGRNTFEAVLSFGIDWPYPKPVFVCSSTLKTVPEELEGKVFLIKGSAEEICSAVHKKGFENLYIDGGRNIQNFLTADLIDELIITRFPILLGGGVPLFKELPEHMEFELVSTEVLLEQMQVSHYRRKR